MRPAAPLFVLVTADSHVSGIGAAIAVSFAQAGATVIIAQRDISNTATRDAIRALPGGKAEIIKCDLNDMENVKGVFDEAVKITGEVDILVNCGGMLIREDAVNVLEEDWNFVSRQWELKAFCQFSASTWWLRALVTPLRSSTSTSTRCSSYVKRPDAT